MEGCKLRLENIKIGFCLTGSFCTFNKVIEQLKKIKEERADIIPIMSFNSYNLDTKFGKAEEFIMANTDKTAVEIEWDLDTPVREDIYEYIVNS